jgi:hypothetical protein
MRSGFMEGYRVPSSEGVDRAVMGSLFAQVPKEKTCSRKFACLGFSEVPPTLAQKFQRKRQAFFKFIPDSSPIHRCLLGLAV